MVKVTFTIDEDTVATLQKTALRLAKPQSAVVREAIREYSSRVGRLSEDERRGMLQSIDALLTHKRDRTAAAVDRELADIRDARRAGRRSGR